MNENEFLFLPCDYFFRDRAFFNDQMGDSGVTLYRSVEATNNKLAMKLFLSS